MDGFSIFVNNPKDFDILAKCIIQFQRADIFWLQELIQRGLQCRKQAVEQGSFFTENTRIRITVITTNNSYFLYLGEKIFLKINVSPEEQQNIFSYNTYTIKINLS